MTVASTTNRNDYIGNGAVDTYAYGFRIFAETDLLVTIADSAGEETELTLTTHYTVSGVGVSSGGNVALVNGSFDWLDAEGDLKTDYAITIRRVRPLTQNTDIRNQGSFFPEDHEDAFDHFIFIAQQLQDVLNRCLKAAETEDQEYTLPPAVGESLIGWNAGGTNLTNYTRDAGTELSKASQAEAEAGTDNAAYMTALRTFQSTKALLLALTTAVNFAKATDKASAGTCDIGAVLGNFVHITGTTTITALGTAQAGAERTVTFTGILTLTHNATSLILPTGANITTAAGDVARFVSEGSGNWRCVSYMRADGSSLSGNSGYISGLVPSNNATDATNDLDFTAGSCRSDDDAFDIVVPALTKKIDAVFAEGDDQGCLDTGTIGASADIIYFYAIGGVGKTGDIVGTKTQGSPSMPSGYTKKRYIFGLRWAGTAWELFAATGAGNNLWIHFLTQRVLTTTATATTYTDLDCSAYVPLGVRQAHVTGKIDADSGQVHARLYWRPNGSSDSAGEGFAGGSTANGYTFVGWSIVVLDANAVFEYTDSGSVDSMSIAIRGYQEVR